MNKDEIIWMHPRLMKGGQLGGSIRRSVEPFQQLMVL